MKYHIYFMPTTIITLLINNIFHLIPPAVITTIFSIKNICITNQVYIFLMHIFQLFLILVIFIFY